MKCIKRIIVGAAVLIAGIMSAKAVDLVPSGNTKTLVAYFSATGNTRAVANRIVQLTGADIYEIEPRRQYADNPYDDSQLIQNEAYNDLRPEVANLPSAENIARYDTIYVGSPLWWHQPAMVVCTFLESYNLSGKVVVPFMTYGATTYLNEGMQKLYKCTPNSIHIPAELPEDIDPDNIREPQNDDDGIDLPNRPSQVEGWLERMGLWPPKDPAGINDVLSMRKDIDIVTTADGISVSLDGTGCIAVYDVSGHNTLCSRIDHNATVPAHKGIYIVNVESDKYASSKKLIVR